MWRDDAEDIVSECVIAMWRNQGKYNPNRGPLLHFMALIIRAEAFRLKRDNNRKYNPEDIEEVPLDAELSDSEGQVSDLIVDPRQRDIADVECEKVAIESLIDSLPFEKQKRIIKLRLEGYSLREAGKIENCSGERIRQIERKAINCMRRIIDGDSPLREWKINSKYNGKEHETAFQGVIFNCDNCGISQKLSLSKYRKSKNHFCSTKCKGIWISKHKKVVDKT
jgi:RNA polymerase sigma factor (sigma-70 family)